jgi:hypothetical protein
MELEKKGKKAVQGFIRNNILQQGLSKTIGNVRPSDVWADTRTLGLNNTKKCYQLDGNIGWFHICTRQYCCDRKLAFGTQLIYINDSP